MVTPAHRKLCGHPTQYLYHCVPWSGKNECYDCNLVGYRVFVDLRDFQNIPALALHSRNCQIAHRVFVFLHWVDPPSRISPFRLGDGADATSSVVPSASASRALFTSPFVFTSIEDVGSEATADAGNAASRLAFIDCLR